MKSGLRRRQEPKSERVDQCVAISRASDSAAVGGGPATDSEVACLANWDSARPQLNETWRALQRAAVRRRPSLSAQPAVKVGRRGAEEERRVGEKRKD